MKILFIGFGNVAKETARILVEKELYPNSNAFGIWAWECTTLENAQIRLMGMQKHERSPKSSNNIPFQRNNA